MVAVKDSRFSGMGEGGRVVEQQGAASSHDKEQLRNVTLDINEGSVTM